ncbi:MAG: hypothetical protein ACFE89_09440 [Candidatus Hodarchaeota archaeon]
MAPPTKPKAKKKAIATNALIEESDNPVVLKQELMEDLKQLFMKGDLPEAKPRDNIVMTRLWDSDLRIVDALIALEIFKSRSEAVAFLTHEGIQAKSELVDTILPAIERIEEIKRRTREQAVTALHKSKR